MVLYVIGTARAAYEYALAYAKERIQGGRPIFEYQLVRIRLLRCSENRSGSRAARHAIISHAGIHRRGWRSQWPRK